MNANIFKFINSNVNGIYASFNNASKSNVKINLFRDGGNIETITTTKDHYVFYIEKIGIYHIEAQEVVHGRDTEKSVSNKISVREINDVADKYPQTNTPLKTKTENKRIDGVDKYYLEMKVL